MNWNDIEIIHVILAIMETTKKKQKKGDYTPECVNSWNWKQLENIRNETERY